MAGPEAPLQEEAQAASKAPERKLTPEEKEVEEFLTTPQGRAMLAALREAYPQEASRNFNSNFLLGCRDVYGDMKPDEIRGLETDDFYRVVQTYGDIFKASEAAPVAAPFVPALTEMGRQYREFFHTPVGILFRDIYYKDLKRPNPAEAYAEGQAFLGAYRGNIDNVISAQVKEWRALGVVAKQNLSKPETWEQIFQADALMDKPAYYIYFLTAAQEAGIPVNTFPYTKLLEIRALAAREPAYDEDVDDLDDASQHEVWKKAVQTYKTSASGIVASAKP